MKDIARRDINVKTMLLGHGWASYVPSTFSWTDLSLDVEEPELETPEHKPDHRMEGTDSWSGL